MKSRAALVQQAITEIVELWNYDTGNDAGNRMRVNAVFRRHAIPWVVDELGRVRNEWDVKS